MRKDAERNSTDRVGGWFSGAATLRVQAILLGVDHLENSSWDEKQEASRCSSSRDQVE